MIGRKRERQATLEVSLPDVVLDVVEACGDDLNHHFVVVGDGELLGDEVELVDVAVAIELNHFT